MITELPTQLQRHIRDEGDCWLWTAATTPGGYGLVRIEGRQRLAHRVVYELLEGPIPEGLTLDHVRARGCRHRCCVNPAHLEAVTVAENNRRGQSPSALNARKTRCDSGHAFDKANTRVNRDGSRTCRACHREAALRYRQRAA